MTNKWLLIQNKGEIDINALILMGGSTKRDNENAIGFFGSGNKYAIALMLKKGIKFTMYSGLSEIQITTKQVEFRDKNFQQILINGQETSLTTDMGPQWESWMSIREWVSNSIDEGESNVITDTTIKDGKEGYTRVYIEHHPDIVEVINNWSKYFAFDRIDSIVSNQDGTIYPNIDHEKSSLLLYRKGIQCYHMPTQKALYTYDIPVLPINESRVLSSTWDARVYIAKFLNKNATVEIARYILSNGAVDNYYENHLDYSYWISTKMCDSWKEAIGNKIIVNNDVSGFFMKEMTENPHYRVSAELAKAIKKSFPEIKVYGVGQDDSGKLNWRTVETTKKIDYMLKQATNFCKEIGYSINYDITIVEFDKEDTLGLAHDNNIYIAAKTFDMGMKEVVMTIMEESEHLKTNYKDETREWATHWIRMYLTSKEESHGIFL